MKKLGIIILICIIISIFFVSASIPRIPNIIKKQINSNFYDCFKECVADKKQSYEECQLDYKANFSEIKGEYKNCLQDSKEIVDKKERKGAVDQCRKDYRDSKKINYLERKGCRKSALYVYRECRDECKKDKKNCMDKVPVCGIDGKTYPNECVLELAGVEKACDVKCPCYDRCFENSDCENNEFCEFEGCLVETGKCVGVPDICPFLLDPVCGCDDNTYDNRCVLKLARVSKRHDGLCVSECASAGETVPVIPDAMECCEGLRKISQSIYDPNNTLSPEVYGEGGKCINFVGAMLCSDCGNSNCEEWENVCNCPEDCVIITNECALPGETVPVIPDAKRCCVGLKLISISSSMHNDLCDTVDGAMLCSECGNRHCEKWENICNCPEDCVITPTILYDLECRKDKDCRLEVPEKLSECLQCDAYGCQTYSGDDEEVVGVNKHWRPKCPIKNIPKMCPTCIGGINNLGFEAKCINNQCIKVQNQE